MIDSAVADLPEPDSPTSATVSPSAMSKEMRSTASVSRVPWRKAMERSLTERRVLEAVTAADGDSVIPFVSELSDAADDVLSRAVGRPPQCLDFFQGHRLMSRHVFCHCDRHADRRINSFAKVLRKP